MKKYFCSKENGAILLYDQLQNEKQLGVTASCEHSCWAELKSMKCIAASEERHPQGLICSNATTAQVRATLLNVNPEINVKLFQKHFEPLLLTAVSIITKANMRSNYVPLGYNEDFSPHGLRRQERLLTFMLPQWQWRHEKRSLWERGRPSLHLFCFSYLSDNLRQGCMRFRVLFIENQYFPFLRMQNELLLRWALCGDWRLSLRHHSSEDFLKDIYFFSPCS